MEVGPRLRSTYRREPAMSNTITLVLAGGLAGSAITYALVSSGDRNPPQQEPPQASTLLGVDEIHTMQRAAAGAWRAGLRAAAPPEGALASEVITVPPEIVRSFSRDATLVPGDRGALARELQRELARVGCYDGEINGEWTTSTRQAMKAFIERVNAALPTHHPDAVLLTLVKGHSGKACGAPCPAGQGRTDTGRCVPTAILQREANRTIPAITGWSTTTTVPGLPLEGQMGLAGPKSEISASKPKAKPVQLVRRNSPIRRQTADRYRLWFW
jgi:peptidoglycan hydrolase-like protein with peptidoglycan-binding domain